jgi:hypothetical protein
MHFYKSPREEIVYYATAPQKLERLASADPEGGQGCDTVASCARTL